MRETDEPPSGFFTLRAGRRLASELRTSRSLKILGTWRIALLIRIHSSFFEITLYDNRALITDG